MPQLADVSFTASHRRGKRNEILSTSDPARPTAQTFPYPYICVCKYIITACLNNRANKRLAPRDRKCPLSEHSAGRRTQATLAGTGRIMTGWLTLAMCQLLFSGLYPW